MHVPAGVSAPVVRAGPVFLAADHLDGDRDRDSELLHPDVVHEPGDAVTILTGTTSAAP